MYESDDKTNEEWDDFLHTQADIGDYYLDQEAFDYRPTQHEMQMLALSDGKYAEMTTGGIVSGNYFDVLGTPMALGRGFRPEEDEALDRNPVLVLGYGLWQRRFAGAPNILGRRLELNRTPFTVIVTPAVFPTLTQRLRRAWKAIDAPGASVFS